MKPLKEIWSLFTTWLKVKIQSPFSNVVTKFLLFAGAMLVATPLLEHLLFGAILKHWLGIDLGIEVPDLKAYISGCFLMFLGAAHNLIFIKLRHERDIQVAEAKTSVYRELWEYCDKAVDDVVRLNNLYITKSSPNDKKYVEQAEGSVMQFMDFLRLHRPFLFSEDFYDKGSELNKSCWWQIRCFRACMQSKKEHEENGNTSYDFCLAEKETKKEMDELVEKYNSFCSEIREFVEQN